MLSAYRAIAHGASAAVSLQALVEGPGAAARLKQPMIREGRGAIAWMNER